MNLQKAIEDVTDGKLSTRAALAKYNASRSTIHDYTILKVKEISRPGPSAVLIETENQKLQKVKMVAVHSLRMLVFLSVMLVSIQVLKSSASSHQSSIFYLYTG